MVRIMRNVTMNFFWKSRFWSIWVKIRVFPIINVDQNGYLKVVPMHILYFGLHHQCVIFWKVNTWNDYVLKHIEKAILKLDILPPEMKLWNTKALRWSFKYCMSSLECVSWYSTLEAFRSLPSLIYPATLYPMFCQWMIWFVSDSFGQTFRV
jgi:hypothetical protein